MKILRIKKWKKQWPLLAAIASLLLLLQLGYWKEPILFPSVPEVFIRLKNEFSSVAFWRTIGASMYRLWIGYPIACFLGGMFGLLAGLYRSFAIYLRNLIRILQSIPPITWLPIFAMIYGFGNIPIIAIVIIASFFPMALSVLNAVEGITKIHLEVAKVLGASKGQQLRKVYFWETLPSFITGAQVAFGNAWRSLIAGEMVGSTMIGLGFSIDFSGQIADTQGLFLFIIVIGAIALVLDQVVLEQLKRRLLRWRYISGEENN